MKQIIAMHGWSGDSKSWDCWHKYFNQKGWIWESGERGYGALIPKVPKWENDQGINDRSIRAVIGHSLGPHLLDSSVLSKASHLVMLGSFSAFLPQEANNRALQKAIKLMQNCIGTNQEKIMLEDFIRNSFKPDPLLCLPSGPVTEGLSNEGRENLREDLEILYKTQGLPKGLKQDTEVLVIEAAQDHILSKSARTTLKRDLLKYLDKNPTIWTIEKTGHALNRPELIQNVENWLEKCQ